MSIETELLQRLQFIDARLRSLERIELPVAGSGGFAPSDAQYLTLAANASLTNERVFTPVAPLVGVDGGAGAAYSLSITAAALTRVNDTNITLTLGGSPASALLAATSLTLGWAGLLPETRGGTGIGSYIAGDILYAANPTTLAQLGIGASGRILSSSGAFPQWSTLASLGIISGTGTSGQMTYWTGTNTVGSAAQVSYATSGDLFTITSGAATDVPLKLVMHASQSSQPFQIVTSGGNLSAAMSATGDIATYGTGGSYTGLRFANASTFGLSRVNGSIGAESNVNSGETIASFVGRSYNGGTFPAYTLVSVSGYSVIAAENHGAGAFGSYFRITTTPIGSASAAVRVIVSPSGNLGVSTATEAGTSATKTLYIDNGVAPSSSPTNITQVHSNDRGGVAGQAWPHVRTEDGTNGSLGITVSEVNLTGQTAAIAATTLYAVPAGAGGVYVIHWVATVTTAATTSSVLGGAAGFQTSYTDGNDSVVKTAPGTVTAGVNSNATNSTATGTITGCYTVFAKASTNISYLIGYTSVGATPMAYNLHIVCRRLT